MTSVIIVVDIGSSSVRASALTADSGELLCLAVSQQKWVILDVDGRADAEIVVDGCSSVVLSLLKALGHGVPTVDDRGAVVKRLADLSGVPTIVTVLFSCFVANMVAVDAESGAIAARAFSYAARHKSVADACPTIVAALGGASAAQRVWQATGAPVHSSYLGPQAAAEWGAGSLTARLDLCTLPALVIARWAGVHPRVPGCSVSEAAWTGLWDFGNQGWHPALAAACGLAVPSHKDSRQFYESSSAAIPAAGTTAETCPMVVLPRVRRGAFALDCDDTTPLGVCDTAFPVCMRNVAALAGTTLALGVGDGAAAAWGSGCHHVPSTDHAISTTETRRPMTASVTVGTSAAVRAVLPRETLCQALETDSGPQASAGLTLASRGLWAYQVTAREVLVGGALTDGASVDAWCDAILLSAPDAASSGSASGGSASGGSGQVSSVVVLPFLSGERATGWDPAARATLAGVSAATTADDIRRGARQGVAMRMAAILDTLRRFWRRCEELATGRAVDATAASFAAAASADLATADVVGVGSGGALEAAETPWPTLVAACLRCPIHLPAHATPHSQGGVFKEKHVHGALAIERTTLGTLILAGLSCKLHGGPSASVSKLLAALSIAENVALAPVRAPCRVAWPPAPESALAAKFAAARIAHDRLYSALSSLSDVIACK